MTERIVASPYGGWPWWRSASGEVVHRQECRYVCGSPDREAREGGCATSAVPWGHAANLDEHQLRAKVAATGWLRLCRVCFPPRVGDDA